MERGQAGGGAWAGLLLLVLFRSCPPPCSHSNCMDQVHAHVGCVQNKDRITLYGVDSEGRDTSKSLPRRRLNIQRQLLTTMSQLHVTAHFTGTGQGRRISSENHDGGAVCGFYFDNV